MKKLKIYAIVSKKDLKKLVLQIKCSQKVTYDYQITLMVLNSQAPDRKSNPHVTDPPHTAVTVKTLSKISKITPTFSQVLKTMNRLISFQFSV